MPWCWPSAATTRTRAIAHLLVEAHSDDPLGNDSSLRVPHTPEGNSAVDQILRPVARNRSGGAAPSLVGSLSSGQLHVAASGSTGRPGDRHHAHGERGQAVCGLAQGPSEGGAGHQGMGKVRRYPVAGSVGGGG